MSVGTVQPFQPAYTLAISAAVTPAAKTLNQGGSSVLITNGAADYAFVRLGAAGVVATSSDIPVPAGGRLLLHAPDTVSAVSIMLNSGTGTVFVSRGSGTAY